MQTPSVPGPATRALHAGRQTDRDHGAIIAPIYQCTTFARESPSQHRDHSYSRVSNPGVAELEKALAAFEGADHGIAFATGMSATTALFFALLRPGDRLVAAEQVYGGTTRLIDEIFSPFGVDTHFVDGRDLEAFARAIDAKTRLVFVESPTNPTLTLTDLAPLARLCSERGVPLAVDNTFLGFLGQDCRALGAPIRLQSTTKYIDGHNATLGGIITTEDAALCEKLCRLRKSMGLGQKPFEAWLTLQGLATLPLRFARQCATATTIARFLAERPDIARVIHPALASHPQFDLAQRQQALPGAIIAFELAGGAAAIPAFVAALRHIRLAENLGSAQSLITIPASMTHADLDPAVRRRLGITPALLRLSVGLEDAEDLQRDLEVALEGAQRS